MDKEISINFGGTWINGDRFEKALKSGTLPPHDNSVSRIIIDFSEKCRIMIDSALRILSLSNQLTNRGKEVILNFLEGEEGTMGYLDRMGFFDFLDEKVSVLPYRPIFSGAKIFRGYNKGVVEIAAIRTDKEDEELPSKLSEALEANIIHRKNSESIGDAAYTVFAELIGNVFRHSSTKLMGFASLQVYSGGGRIKVVVSDSGDGIIKTLRPAIYKFYPELMNSSDTDLLVEAFRNGLSRFGAGNGCGLRQCARHAIKFKAELDIRLPTSWVHLTPSPDGYQPSKAYCYENIPLMWGTHICFDFRLDS